MGLLAWLRGHSNNEDPRLTEWRRKWSRAVETPERADDIAALQTGLESLGLPDDEIEVEREMLDALRELVQLRAEVDRSGLPSVETGHRVIGTDTCHFSAPVSLPDDQTQPAGRLLLTSARAVFAGGARTKALPWHGVSKVVQSDRDIVLVRKDRDHLHRFRCNTYADALRGALIARRLAAGTRSGGGVRQP